MQSNEVCVVVTSLAWKILDPFVESDGGQGVYGFRLHGHNAVYDFYTENEEALRDWLDFLVSICINPDFDEDYRIGKLLGSRPRLFRGTEVLSNTQVLIHRIPAQDSEALAEVQFFRRHHHASILHLLRVYEDAHYVSLVFTSTSARDLITYVQEKGILSVHQAKRFITQLANLFEYLDDQALVYEDHDVAHILVREQDLQPFIWKSTYIKPGKDVGRTTSAFLGKVLQFVLTGMLVYNREAERWKRVGKIELDRTARVLIELLTHSNPQERLSLQGLYSWVPGPWRARTLSYLSETLEQVSVTLPVSEVKAPGMRFHKKYHLPKANSM